MGASAEQGLQPVYDRFTEGVDTADLLFASATMIQEIEFAPDSPLEGTGLKESSNISILQWLTRV